MENPPFEDVFPTQDGDFPLLCLFTGGYMKWTIGFYGSFILGFSTMNEVSKENEGHAFNLPFSTGGVWQICK